MSDELEQMTPNQRRALNEGLAALEAMATIWAAEIDLPSFARRLAETPEHRRAEAIAAMVEQAFIEGAYRHYLDRDPNAPKAAQRGHKAQTPVAKPMKLYFLRVAIGFDQFVQAFLRWGVPGITISSRIGTAAAHRHLWGICGFWILDRTPWLGFGKDADGVSHCVLALRNDVLRARAAEQELLGDPVVVAFAGKALKDLQQ